MGKTTAKNNSFKYIIIALVVLFAIITSLCFLKVFENRWGNFSFINTQDNSIIYQGNEYVLKDNVETFLVIGLDEYESDSSPQADFLMLFVFNNETKQCKAIHINRDTVTKINELDVGGTTVVETHTKQIAFAYNYATGENEKIRCRNIKEAVENLLCGIKVDRYLSLTMDSVVNLNDLVGGVEVTVLDELSGIDAALSKSQKVTLTGEKVLNYVCVRQGLTDDAKITRTERQRQYVDALYRKTVSCIKSDDKFILEWLKNVNDHIVYDSSHYKMQEIAKKFGAYEFLGIEDIKGDTKLSEGFIEFYPDENSVREKVIELFYTLKDK